MEIGQKRAGTLHGRFEEQARRAPDAVAVRFGGQDLTYGELDARANQLARYLAASGLAPGGLAAVALGRGAEVFVALLAVLKAGGAYVPLEPGAPDPLLRHVLADAAPAVVVTEEAHRVRLTDASGRAVVCVDSAAEAVAALSADPPQVPVDPADLACVFFTSGSTALPKGALIEHRRLLAAYEGWREVYALTAADRILQTASLEFDVFTADWVRALCTGATLVVAPRNLTLDRTADIAELPALVAAEGVTVLELNATTARRLRDRLDAAGGGEAFAGVRLLTVGAEKWYLDEQLALRRLLGGGVRVLNVYGLAEASVDSTYFDADGVTEDGRGTCLVGVPFPGSRVYVLGPDGGSAPRGAVGEIAVAGAGLGRGYLKRPEEDALRFRRAGFDPDGRILLTGDVGRIREDGVLEFLGRAEAVRGSATKTGAARTAGIVARVAAAARAEGVLRSHPGVRECAVAEVEVEPGRRAVVGYAVAAPGSVALDPWSLSLYLDEHLPTGEAPAAVVPLPALPRTRAGKLDRGALPLPAPRDYTGPRSGKAGRGSAKSGGRAGAGQAADRPPGCIWALPVLFFAYLAWVMTDTFFPRSTDTSLVPSPYAGYFTWLYVCECLAFGAGVTFLLFGPRVIARFKRPLGLSVAANLSVFWLLAAWWPQDNLYRISSPTDWPRQAVLVYVFNVALMVAALVLVRFLAWRSPTDRA
ncbi:amino acid adenylation domain-containing protein [Kitasatospora sp. NPDC058170]|uniref:amino acid adenylation domain-containing protein n=1 Tax=Kitasatospora sp. NPDC058170 TaxID=3346364 RepID=UPI0036D7E21B